MTNNLDNLKSIGFDMLRIAELVDLFESQEEVFALIREMHSDSIGIVDEIQTFISAADYTAAMQKSHYLKGVARNVGASTIAEAANALEVRLGNNENFAAELEQLRLTWNTLTQILL